MPVLAGEGVAGVLLEGLLAGLLALRRGCSDLDEVPSTLVEGQHLLKRSGDDRFAHGVVVVQFGRIDILRVLRQAIRDNPHVDLFEVAGQFRVGLLSQEEDVALAAQETGVGLNRADQDKGIVPAIFSQAAEQVLIEPLMDASHVADERPLQVPQFLRRKFVAVSDLLRGLEIDAGRKQMDLPVPLGGPVVKLPGGDEDEVRLPEQFLLAGDDPPGRRGAVRKAVDAMVNEKFIGDLPDHLEGDGGGKEGPADGGKEVHQMHPPVKGRGQQPSVDPPGDPRVRKRKDQRGEDVQIFLFFPEPLKGPPPFGKPVPDPGQIPQLRVPDTRILNEQDPVSLRGQGGHDLLVSLPDKIPDNG